LTQPPLACAHTLPPHPPDIANGRRVCGPPGAGRWPEPNWVTCPGGRRPGAWSDKHLPGDDMQMEREGQEGPRAGDGRRPRTADPPPSGRRPGGRKPRPTAAGAPGACGLCWSRTGRRPSSANGPSVEGVCRVAASHIDISGGKRPGNALDQTIPGRISSFQKAGPGILRVLGR
jgi:hypothetical protein